MQSAPALSHSRTLVASIPGGPARQYRVQFQPAGQSTWRMFASFQKAEPAQSCASQLQSNGITARVVAIRISPTAA